MRKTLADTIVTVNNTYAYHIEAAVYNDRLIVIRLFDYGYAFARREHREAPGEPIVLQFPHPMVLYLTPADHPQKYEEMILDFGEQGQFTYRVPVVCFSEMSLQEIKKKCLQILLPFRLLRLRALLEKDRSEKSINGLKFLMENDIFNTIRDSYDLGLLEANDARILFMLTRMLYDHLYAGYTETKELTQMYDESILFDFEIAEREKDLKIEEQIKRLMEKEEQIKTQNSELRSKEEQLKNQGLELLSKEAQLKAQSSELFSKEAQLKAKEEALAQQKKENERLRAELAKLKTQRGEKLP